jgi:dipeptidyl aminopeptidase/acylaminoacyl peptidase
MRIAVAPLLALFALRPEPAAAQPAGVPTPVAPNAVVAPDPPAPADADRLAELSAKATVLVDAHADYDAAFTADDKKVVFVSNRDGLPQLYLADRDQPAAPPLRLTRTSERVTAPLPLPDGSILYRSDRGADENWSIFKVGSSGGEPIELTPGEKLQRDTPIAPAGAPGTIFFSGRKLADPASSLYSQAVTGGGTPRRVYGEAVPGSLLDVSDDGKQALWLRFLSFSEGYVLVVDVASGSARLLYPPAGNKARVLSASFGPDGKRVFIASDDAGGAQNIVVSVDAASGKELARHVERRPATALVQYACPAPQGDRLLVGVTAGDHGELRLLKASTLKAAATVKLPVGSGGAGVCPQAFSADGKRVLISWSTPQAPSDLLSIDVATGRASPLFAGGRPGLAGLPGIDTTVVQTRAFDGGRIPMLVYRPRGIKGKLPVIVSYHGGPAGVSTARWSAQIRFFTSLGYAYVEPNVRGSSGYGRAYEEADNGRRRLDAFKDVESSARWVAAQPWADKDRLVIFGGSYGGYTTLIGLTRQQDLWRAGVNLFGVADTRTLLKTTMGVIRDWFKLEFGELGKDDDFLASISPLKDADKIVDPMFVYAGANDPRVPRSESDMIVSAVRKKGVPVEYMVKDNEGHSLSRKENQVEFYARAARFLEKHLALPPKQAAEQARPPKGS